MSVKRCARGLMVNKILIEEIHVNHILDLDAEGESIGSIASKSGVSRKHVNDILDYYHSQPVVESDLEQSIAHALTRPPLDMERSVDKGGGHNENHKGPDRKLIPGTLPLGRFLPVSHEEAVRASRIPPAFSCEQVKRACKPVARAA